MTEFQELQIKHNFHLANMICTLHSENMLIADMLRILVLPQEIIDQVKNISDDCRESLVEEFDDMKKDLKQYYKYKAGE